VRILTRYILGEVVSHALLGLVLFTFILFMPNLVQILELVVQDGAPASSIVKLVAFALPNALTVTIPMAVLVGILLGLSRLAADSEITAMRASGIGVLHFVRIVAIVGAGAWLIGLFNSHYVAPRATTAMLQVENSLRGSQATFQIQPHVFYEDFHNYVLYVQDVHNGPNAAVWSHVFLANVSDPKGPNITVAQQATVAGNPRQGNLRIRLRKGEQHEIPSSDPGAYNISTFAQMDLPIQIDSADQDTVRIGHSNVPILATPDGDLLREARQPDGERYGIEFQQRFAYPTACLVLMLIGIPLGLSSRRGGKSTGFVLTVFLVFVYYFLSSTGTALAKQGKIPVFAGVWGANVLFAVAGLLLLRQMTRGALRFSSLRMPRVFRRHAKPEGGSLAESAFPSLTRPHRQLHHGFPYILDDYVLRSFAASFLLVEVSFVLLSLIFSFFELLGDIVRNRASLALVGDYLLNLTPMMIYNITPLSVLIAVLVTMSVLNRTSELTAMKATGISLYRIVLPLLLVACALAVLLFSFGQFYLPDANRKQEALRSEIKGKPPRTFLRPGREWVFGQSSPGKPPHIFHYQFFDSANDRFANIAVLEFQPNSFVLTRRIFATDASWDPGRHEWIFRNGWDRTFQNGTIASYKTFATQTFPEIGESPGYFKKENLQSSEMTFAQLAHYIHNLSQSGFDTVPLRVQLNKKIAYPLVTLIMAILAIPFALSTGRRGSLAGIAIAIGVAIAYWVIAGLFEAMGNVNTLPAALAAWSPDLLFGLVGGYLLLRAPT
jgi:LPS export ABC transporter permease LptF/LPS export ABC transporter permease LptG